MKNITNHLNKLRATKLFSFSLLVALCIMGFDMQAQTTQTFSSSGTFVVPAGVTTVQVEAWGGGAAGGGNTTSADGGGGGGGGAYSKTTGVSVTGSPNYTVTVGAGGAGTTGDGAAGGDSWFGSATTVMAKGGAGGISGTLVSGAAGGAGGSTAASVGTTKFSGGNGGSGRNSSTGQGGPGGSSAGTAANGVSGATTWSTVTSGTAPTGAGKGGNGGTTGNSGSAGAIPGAGGGGSGDGTVSGGAGAAGKVLVTYTCPTYALTAAASATGPFCSASTSTVTLRSSSMPSGTYTVTYNLTGGNGATGSTATMTFTAGSPGTGTFTTSTLNASATATTIAVTALSSGGCSSAISSNNTATVSIPVYTVSAGAAFSKTCTSNVSGATIGEAPVTGYTYSWSPTTGLSSSTIGNPFANPSVTTTYTVTKTNTTSGCAVQATVLVTVDNSPITVSAGNAFTKTCATNATGAAIGETNVTGNTYSWSPTTGLSSPTVSNPTANPTTTTTYTVTKTNSTSGCSATAQVIVTVDTAAPTVSAGTAFSKTCVANTSGAQIGETAQSGYTYSWTPTNGLSASNISNPIANPTVNTTYTVTKTSAANGCSATATVVVTVNNTLTVSAGTDFTKTCTSNASGAAIGETNVSGNTYSWSPTTGLSNASISNPTANPSVTTTYTVIKTNGTSGCVATDQVVVTVNNTPPTVSAGTSFTKTCVTNPSGATIGETAQTGNTYSWSPTTGLSSSTVSNPTANPTATTTYTVTKTTTANGCTATSQVVVTVDTTVPTVAALTGTQTVCAGSNTLFSSTTGGGVWSTSNGAIATVNAGTVTGVGAGTATISYTVTGANGCSTTVTRTVTVSPLPVSVTASGAAAICPASSTLLTGSASIPYTQTNTISTDNFNGTPSYTGAGSGTIFAQKTSGSVVGVTTITNNIDSSKFMMASQSSAFSNASTVSTLTSTSFNITGYVTPLALTFNHSYQKGDSGTQSAVVQVSIDGGTNWTNVKSYTTNQGANNNFVAETINLDAYLSNLTLKIRFSTTVSTFFGTGWWAIDNVALKGNVTVFPIFSWIADTAAGVNGLPSGAATPSAGNASISVNPTADTNYTLVAQDPLTGCTQNATPIQVTVKATPVANAIADATYCNGISAVAVPLSGTPSGVTFDISGGAAIGLSNVNGVTSIPSFTTIAGSANISITPKANGCTGTPITYHVLVNPTPTASNPGAHSYCNNVTAASIALTGTPSGVTFDISGGAAIGLADVTNVTAVPSFTTVAGSANISITPHANGCSGIVQTYAITVNPTPTATAPADQIYCNGVTASAIGLSGSPSGVTYDISGGAAIGLANVNGVTAIPSFNPIAGNATISITPKANGCSGNAVTYHILVNPTPTAIAPSNHTYCTGEVTSAIALSGSPAGVTYDISGGSSIGLADAANVTAIPSFTITGNATITITPKANGCTGNPVTYNASVNAVPTVTNPGDLSYCNGFNTPAMALTGSPSGVTFSISGGASIGLANASGVTSIPVFRPVLGSATITITPSANGCTGSPVTFNATVNPIVTPTFTQVSPICSGSTLSALPTTSNNGITGSWSPVLNNTQTTLYTFTPTTGQCANAVTMTIVVNTNTTYYADTDGDGYGDAAVSQTTCLGQPNGYVTNGTDCNVNDASVYRNGSFYVDNDNDTYNDGSAPQTVCYGANTPTGFVAENNGVDCNDFNAEINPWHVEVLGNGSDDNCDGNVDEVGPVTVIIASQCGTTLSYIGNTIYVSRYAQATGYRFQVTNGSNVRLYDTDVNRMSLLDLPGGVTYNTTYSIRVSLLINGFWQAYGASCDITTPANPATTNVVASMCGTTLASMSTTIYCNQVSNANQYRFEVSDGVNTPLTIDSPLNRFNMDNIAGTLYNTTYAVRVALRFGSTWQDYGTACNIMTPETPGVSHVIASQCGITVNSFWSTIYAQQVSAASGYRFEVSDGATVRYFDTPSSRFALRQLTGTVSASTTYTIRVAILFHSVYLPFGPACTITTSAGATGRHAENAVEVFDVKISPNPYVDSFKINMNTSGEENVTYKVYDMIGRLVESKALDLNALGEATLGASYPSGVYNIIVTQGENVKTLRVIKR